MALGLTFNAMAQLQPDAPPPQARVIVKLKDSSVLVSNPSHMAQIASTGSNALPMRRLGERLGMTLEDGREVGARMHVATASGMSSQALAAILAKQSDVELAVVDHWRKLHATLTPNDPFYADTTGSASPNPHVTVGQWYLRAPTATVPAGINAPTAWALTTGSANVTVAVVDTGVRFDHPDLVSKLQQGYNFITSAVQAGNSTGRSSDASDLGDWLTQAEIDANPTVYKADPANPCTAQASSSWHGTQVASIIGAASNNGTGMASVAWGSPILPVRALGKCGGYDSDIAAGMLWAAGLNSTSPGFPALPSTTAKVLNLSLGGSGTCAGSIYTSVLARLTAANVVVVASAGNEQGKAVSVPANCPGVIAVGGLRHAGTKAGYSSLGPEVTLSAPSGNCLTTGSACVYPILTATNAGSTTPVAGPTGAAYSGSSFAEASFGTSFSAPQVSGAVALMLSRRPELTPAAVAQILKNTARPFSGAVVTSGTPVCQAPSSTAQAECQCTTSTCGAGMLDVGLAVAAATEPVPLVTVTPITDANGTLTRIDLGALGSLPSANGVLPNTTAGYTWAVVSNGGIVGAPVATNDPKVVSFAPTASGSFQVSLTVTDSLNHRATTLQTVTVAQGVVTNVSNPTGTGGAVTPAPTVSANGGGGGGGALGNQALLALALLAAAAQVVRRRA